MSRLRVLSLDGGGMRGLYTASYLDCLATAFQRRRGSGPLDVGKGFDLIVGTSTGAIIACALASAVPLSNITKLYKQHGKAIFPRQLPTGIRGVVGDIRGRPHSLALGTAALTRALEACLGSATLGQVYKNREIALSIPAVELEHHASFVFKTPHLPGSMHRDDGYRLVDVCLASSAAPIYRSLAAIETPGKDDEFRVFADGGLWANNPVLVGLVDALQMTKRGDTIEIFSMGTCPRPSGDFIKKAAVHRGLPQWKFGGSAATLGMDAQEFAYDNIVRLLIPHLDRDCRFMRFPKGQVPAEILQYLELDDTRDDAARALIAQAQRDAELTNSRSNDERDKEGSLVRDLFMEMPLA